MPVAGVDHEEIDTRGDERLGPLEGVGADAGGSGVPDIDAEDVGAPPEGGSAVDSPEAPVDLPPALDGGQPPNADDADLNVDQTKTTKGSD